MEVDIDTDFDGEFLNQFRSMGTTDRDVLIAEFRTVVGNTATPESCAFYLDMNNWNLQNAICSYYDLQQQMLLPGMTVVSDITIGNGEAVAPNSTFYKAWRIKNSGSQRWPEGCKLGFSRGDNLSAGERLSLPALGPGESTDITVEMKSPSAPGRYNCIWRCFTPIALLFGDEIQWSIEVAEGGLLSLTQQLARINGGTASGGEATQSQQQMAPSADEIMQQQGQVILYSFRPLPDAVIENPPAQTLPTVEEDTEML